MSSLKVHFKLSKKFIFYDSDTDKFSSILDLADKAGLDIRRGCRSGHCKLCEVNLKSGKVDHIFGEESTKQSPTTILSCSFKPKTDIIVEA